MNFRVRSVLPIVVALVLATPAVGRSSAAAEPQDPESLFVSGRFELAERAFEARRASARDTLRPVRLAALRLLRNDTRGARALLEPLLAKRPDLVSARALLLEARTRELDFAGAVELASDLGREPFARQLASFAGVVPYRLEGPERAEVRFVRTDPLPLVEARLEGRGPFYFLIDTGGGELLVDPVIADSLGAPRFGAQSGTFGGGRKRDVELSRIGALALGDVTIRDLPATLLDCSRFSAAAGGKRVAGILGTRVLMRFLATLDYPGGKLVLERRAREPAASDSGDVVVPMWLAGDHFVLARGRMNDAPEALWFVDTGLAGAAITAPASALLESGIAVPDTSAAPSGMGGGGSMRVQFFPVSRFELGGAKAAELAGLFGPFPSFLERAFGYRIAGIVSHAFFRDWRVTFDFDRMRLVLAPPEASAK